MTNIYIEKVRPNYNRERDASETCIREIKALLGILYTIDGPFLIDNAASCVVKRLANPILNTGRNITFDNWFTSFPLADYLLQNKTTMVGTVRKNKREIPPEFLILKGRDLYSSYFGFSKNKSIVSYKAKSNKIVFIASAMHNDKAIDMNTGEKLKPEMRTFYNSTKSGVDTIDWMTENYSAARHSACWPLTVFYSLLNFGGLNSMIVYQENTQVEREVLPQKLRSSNRCAFCERAKDKKTTKVCTNCIKPICRDHLIEICQDCFTL
ncbi:PiggyBac transposable element-derived protein [Cinara cedri]|uniref:PiggyBac transposable element-derived protein n=1 Tax=Cinara cedri TaxID=506608 RepID=A0A5E4NT30_9HEMI|nr:PiggyBac transposable element-derived protein [Cinara cedri]